MPTITIRDGKRTLKLTKREREALKLAQRIADDIAADYEPARSNAESVSDYIVGLLGQIDKATIEARVGQPPAEASK